MFRWSSLMVCLTAVYMTFYLYSSLGKASQDIVVVIILRNDELTKEVFQLCHCGFHRMRCCAILL